MKQRYYWVDNIKAILIFLVVLGHLLELIPGNLSAALYRIIYLFHMPIFIFISGYLSKYRPKKIFLKCFCFYLIMQTLYLLFDGYFISGLSNVRLQYTTPYWILWYLMVIVLYRFLIPLLDTDNIRLQIIEIIISFGIGLSSGLDQTLGYYLSLSRFFTFLPFFVLGYNIRKNRKFLKRIRIPNLMMGCLVSIIILSVYWIIKNKPSIFFLYGCYPYSQCNGSVILRLWMYICASSWGILLYRIVPNIRIRMFDVLARNTLYVYILHGFVIRLIMKYQILHFSELANIILAFLYAIVICFVFGNSYCCFRRTT